MEDEKRLYMYVYRMIRADIYNGKYVHGSKLPSLIELCEEYDVGRNTVRSALIKLQEKGYVIMQKGTQATVVFDTHDFQDHQEYVQELVNSYQMTKDIFNTFELVFPEIAYICLARLTSSEFQELSQRIKNLSLETINNARELIQEIYSIYLFAFSALKNPLLNDLFMAMMNSIYYPITDDEHVESELRKNIKMIRTSLGMLLKFAKIHNKFMVKSIIGTMCKTEAKLVDMYMRDNCGNLEAKTQNQFIWVGNRNQDFLYAYVVSSILRDVNNRVYNRGAIIPSISKLSEKYGVSEKTTRKALDVLRDYRVIETINGIGSRIVLNEHEDKEKLLAVPELKEKIKEYFYSLELISILGQIFIKKTLNEMSEDDFLEIQSSILNDQVFNLEYLYDYIFEKTNPCLKSIYYELKKSLSYHVVIYSLLDTSQYDFESLKSQYIHAFRKDNADEIYKLTEQLAKLSLTFLNDLIKEIT
ncbi:MAG: GntR family transcriptional regulator [Longibaculum sp.]